MTLSATGIYSYALSDLYSAKTLYRIKTKTTEVGDKLYSYITSRTKHIGESAPDILRRMLRFSATSQPAIPVTKEVRVVSPTIVEAKPVKMTRDKIRAMCELLFLDEYVGQKRTANRFMLLLSTLYSPDAWVSAETTELLHGCTRAYSAINEQMLLKDGNQIKPKHVPGTSYWVVTNTNTGHKYSMTEHIV